MEEQKILFERIKSKIHKHRRLADVIGELLEMSEHSAYRRIRGDQKLSFPELRKICDRFNLSMDEILNCQSNKGVLFHNVTIDLSNRNAYLDFLKIRAGRWNKLKSASDIEFCCTAHDIPFYHVYQYPELNFFRLFTSNCILNHSTMSYDSFCDSLEKDKIVSMYQQIRNSTLLVPSREIWCDQTIDTLLRLLAYHYESGAFESKNTVHLLLHQLTNLLDTVEQYAKDGYKDVERKISFTMYVCSINLENNILLAKHRNNFFCAVKLYLNNSIETENPSIADATKQWLDDMIAKSTLISNGTSVKERGRFFRSSRDKIQHLAKKIKSNNFS